MNQIRNMAASAHDRLLLISRERNEDFNLTLNRYAVERILYRLGNSEYRARFILKGAMLFTLWGGPIYRPTRDLDLAGPEIQGVTELIAVFRRICGLETEPDGLIFEDETFSGETIRDGDDFGGIRIRFAARLGQARIRVQIDVGFGDAIEPPPEEAVYPTLLDLPHPVIRAYRRETVVAEKAHAMVVNGERNSRMKDFFDIQAISRQFAFEGGALGRSIRRTFKGRNTEIGDVPPIAFQRPFYTDEARSIQWRSYLTRDRLTGVPVEFTKAGDAIIAFLKPIWTALAENFEVHMQWNPGGPWRENPG
jgi:hypothetical protein